jgi:hypothetical protein
VLRAGKKLDFLRIKRKGQNLRFALSHCQNIKTTTAYENLLTLVFKLLYIKDTGL